MLVVMLMLLAALIVFLTLLVGFAMLWENRRSRR